MSKPSSTSSFSLIWTTTDIFGNSVDLYHQDWAHAINGHPEMVGREHEVKNAVEKPIKVVEAGFPEAGAFYGVSLVGPEGIRVLVQYTNETFNFGGISGFVTTVYPIDSATFSKPRLGGELWPKHSIKGGK